MKMSGMAMKTSPEQMEMLKMLKEEDAKLSAVLKEMNEAAGDQKMDAVVKSINAIADQHRKMQAMFVGYLAAQQEVAKANNKSDCCNH